MKIAFLTWQFPNWHNTFTLNELIEIERAGHQITVFLLSLLPKRLTPGIIGKFIVLMSLQMNPAGRESSVPFVSDMILDLGLGRGFLTDLRKGSFLFVRLQR